MRSFYHSLPRRGNSVWLADASHCTVRFFSVSQLPSSQPSTIHFSVERFRDPISHIVPDDPSDSSKLHFIPRSSPSSSSRSSSSLASSLRRGGEEQIRERLYTTSSTTDSSPEGKNGSNGHRNGVYTNGKNGNGNGNGFYNGSKDKLHITVLGDSKVGSSVVYTAEEMSLDEVMKTRFDHTYSDKLPVWISVSGADDLTYKELGTKFNLHPLTVEDCQSVTERGREKVEAFPDYTFLIFEVPETAEKSSPTKADEKTKDGDACELPPKTISIRLLVFKNCLLSFHPRGVKAIKNVKMKLQKVHDYHIPSTSWLVHAILDGMIDDMVPEVDKLMSEISTLDNLLLSGEKSPVGVRSIANLRLRLLGLRQSLWPKRDILTSLIAKEKDGNGDRDRQKQEAKDHNAFISGQMPYLRDVHDHLSTMLEKVERANDLLNAFQGNYLASISIKMSEQSEQLAQAMKKLTAMATICLPLSLVTGLFGMNVPVPLQPESITDFTNPRLIPFYLVTGFIGALGVGTYKGFKKKGYL